MVPEILRCSGLEQLFIVQEQALPDGSFPTVKSPNPENPEGFSLGIELAKEVESDLIIATDPDCDRVGVMAKNAKGQFETISGNCMGCLLLDYILSAYSENGTMPPDPYAVKTIVSTDLAEEICRCFGVKLYEVLTGFKYIGEVIKRHEDSGKGSFILGFEESYGYLKGTYARDKDAVVASMLITEMAAYYKEKDMTLIDARTAMYEKYGYFAEKTENFQIAGLDALEKMQNIILKSQDISAYLTPVDERLKREERPEYRYFFALLQEQLIMMMEGKKDFNLENVLRKIYGTEYTPVQAVRAALELLLYTERLQLFEADAIRNAAGNGILRLAAREPEAFANNDVAASYQLLKEDTARELNLGRFLNRLDDEWKSIYCKRYGGRVSRREYRESYDRPEQRRPYPGSARTRYELDEDEEMDEEDESSPIILIIAAVVALLVGVAISLVLCLLVPDKITMAISIGLILVGITGDIVIIIHNIIASKRRER